MDDTKLYRAVVYTDGSCGPGNNSFYGSGAHGYIYCTDTLGKQTSNRPTKNSITDIGYISADELAKDPGNNVTPEYYINGCYSFDGISTNNVAEILAVNMSIENLINNSPVKLEEILLKIDSSYTIFIFETIINSEDHAWRTRIEKNVNLWEDMLRIITLARGNDIRLRVMKVKGHSNAYGNHISDRLALAARMATTNGVKENDFKIVPAKNYYKSAIDERHPFLRFKQLFFMGLKRPNDTENIYSIMRYDKDTEPGRKTSDCTFGLVILTNSEPMVEDLLHWYKQKLGSLSVVATLDLDVVYSRHNKNYYNMFKNKVYMYDRNQRILKLFDESPVVYAIKPPGLAASAIERTAMLYHIAEEYRNLDKVTPIREYIDITDKLFSFDGKKHKMIIKGNDAILHIPVNVKDGYVHIPIALGQDCITRDNIKQLETLNPDIKLVIERAGDKIITYYVLIASKTTGDLSIWCNFFTNMFLINDNTIKK